MIKRQYSSWIQGDLAAVRAQAHGTAVLLDHPALFAGGELTTTASQSQARMKRFMGHKTNMQPDLLHR